MSWSPSTLLVGLAQYAAANSVGGWTTGPVTDPTFLAASGWPFVIGPLPDAPDLCVGLGVYSESADPVVTDYSMRVQFLIRGVADQPLSPDTAGDPLFDLFHGATNLAIGAVTVAVVERVSVVPMGRDSKNRPMVGHNYEFVTDRPTLHNNP